MANSPAHQFINSPIAEITIVGAGITGLTAAYELHRLGLRPVVFEAGPRAGGLIRTDRIGGFTIEAGPDSVLATKPAALDLARELGLADRIQHVQTPGAFVLRGRKLFRLPSPSRLGLPLTFGALARYDLLPWSARLRLARSFLGPLRHRTFRDVGGSEPDVSVAEFFRSRFGPETVDLIAQPLLGGIHAGDIEQLSMASLFPRLLELDRTYGSVFRAPREGSRSPFASLRGGMSVLVSALEARLPPGTVRYDSPIDAADIVAGGARAGSHSSRASATIFAAPAHVAATVFQPIDAEAAALCARVPYVSTASVALAWPPSAVAHPLDGTGFVVARAHSDVRITACTWVSAKWAERAPADMVLLRAFVGGAHDPGAVSLTDDELVSTVRRDLGAVMGITAQPALARVYRWLNAGAQHTVGHLDRVTEIERRLAPRGIFVAGSGFRSVGIPDCVADARRVAADAAAYVRRSTQRSF